MSYLNKAETISKNGARKLAPTSLAQLADFIRWDLRVNDGLGFDQLRAKFLLVEVRIEQYIYQKFQQSSNGPLKLLWYLTRFFGSIYQWLLCSSQIPGSVEIGRGLRLPHPQNLIFRYHAQIGEFCTIYHDVSIVWNGFHKPVPQSPKIGSRVLIGCGAIIIGDIEIGEDVLIGAGAVVPKSVPARSRVTLPAPDIAPRSPSHNAAEAGSEHHLKDPYSIWR